MWRALSSGQAVVRSQCYSPRRLICDAGVQSRWQQNRRGGQSARRPYSMPAHSSAARLPGGDGHDDGGGEVEVLPVVVVADSGEHLIERGRLLLRREPTELLVEGRDR